jgi:hypothetical protein
MALTHKTIAELTPHPIRVAYMESKVVKGSFYVQESTWSYFLLVKRLLNPYQSC